MIARLKPLVSTRFWKLVVIATVFALPLLALNIGIMSAKRAWVSDDIDQQLLISDVHHGQPLDASFGQDTFILKYPLYALVGRVMPHDPEALVVTASVLMVAMLALFNVFQFLVHSSRRLGILLSLYVASIGGYALAFLIMPNIRNVELPAGLLTALTTSLYYSGKWRKTWPRTAILILVSAVQMVSDAYVFYFFLLPMSVGIVILLADKKQAVKDQLVYLAGVYVSWKVGVKVLAWLGLRELGQPINPPLHTLIS
ncbi:MAG TPA: hypothetical protein VGS28_01995, partial [Candidatus Saccharimonadales bacterium]|nr:hypothetical protein [Candidatus Saccharimonadales bacterium]